MGSYLTSFFSNFGNIRAKILMLGLDAAGKTTILYQFKLCESVNTAPTIGFNVEEVQYKNLKFTIWDIGGQTKLINMWKHYYEGTDALIYVLDSADEQRMNTAKQVLNSVISDDSMTNVPVLVLANKMDISTSNMREIAQKLGLHQLRRKWNLQACCALNGQGLVPGFEWLRKQLANKK